MKDLSDENKLSVRSTEEVFEALGHLVARSSSDKAIRYRGTKKPGKAAVVNALVLYVDSLPVVEQKRVLGEGMSRLNAILSETDQERAEAQSRLDTFSAGDMPVASRPVRTSGRADDQPKRRRGTA